MAGFGAGCSIRYEQFTERVIHCSKGTTFLEQLTQPQSPERCGAQRRGLYARLYNTNVCTLHHKFRRNIVPGSFNKTVNAEFILAAKY